MKRFLPFLLLIFTLSMPGCAPEKTVSLNFAVEMNDHAASAYIAKFKGDYQKYGIDVHSFNQYSTGMELAAALSRGDINVGYICVVPAIIAYSRGVPIKIIALTHQYGYELVVQKDINAVSELNNAQIACPGEGSAANLVMRIVEEKYNIKFRALRTKPIEELTLMEKGAVKAVFIPEHYASILASKGFKILLKAQDIFPEMPGSCIVVKDSLIEQDPDTVRNLVRLNIKETKFINLNKNESAKIISGFLNTDPSIILNSMNNIFYTNEINKEKIQEEINLLAKWGYIKRFNAEEIVWREN